MRLANIFRNGGHPRPIAYRQGGFTLIEVMIAVLVLLVGLLGVAGIQIVSFQNNQGAYFRSQATFMASDFLDRMRANPAGRSISAYDGVNTNSVTAPSCDIASSAGCSDFRIGSEPPRRSPFLSRGMFICYGPISNISISLILPL